MLFASVSLCCVLLNMLYFDGVSIKIVFFLKLFLCLDVKSKMYFSIEFLLKMLDFGYDKVFYVAKNY